MSYGLYIQVDLYIESLWKEIEHHSHQNVYNGAVHASHAIISEPIKNSFINFVNLQRIS